MAFCALILNPPGLTCQNASNPESPCNLRIYGKSFQFIETFDEPCTRYLSVVSSVYQIWTLRPERLRGVPTKCLITKWGNSLTVDEERVNFLNPSDHSLCGGQMGKQWKMKCAGPQAISEDVLTKCLKYPFFNLSFSP